jgi:uncharacterized Fe-S center protein
MAQEVYTPTETAGAAKVYMTSDISPAGLMAVYEALGREATGKVAVKIHFGEPGGHNYLSPNLIKELVSWVNATILEKDIIGAGFRDYDFHIVLSHFKGHAMGGFGGAIKNMSIGYASSNGKGYIHSAGAGTTWAIPGRQEDFLESMAEAAKLQKSPYRAGSSVRAVNAV